MRTRIMTMLAALLLISTGAFAQSESTLKGDVNEDGKVDVADINAVIKIMKDAGGTAEAPTYYWYVGQTDPSTMSSISPIVTDNSSPGWRLTGNSLNATYNYDTVENQITSTPSQNAPWYFALPQNSGLGVFDAQNTNYAIGTPISTITLNNVTYNIWKTGSSRKFGAYYIHNKPTIYYWYVGATQPTAVNQPTTWRISNKDAGFSETVVLSEGITWFAYPNTWTYSAIDSTGDEFAFNAFVNATTKNSISGYILLKMSLGATETVTITFSK